MIFKTIRNNHFLLLFTLGLLVSFAVLSLFMANVPGIKEYSLPLFFMENWFVGPKAFHFILGLLFQFLNALLLLSIANELKLFSKGKLLIPLVYFLLSIAFHESFFFNPIHLSSFIFLIVIRLILNFQMLQNVNFHLMGIGTLVIISGMIYPPFFLFILAALLAILIIRPFRIREILIYLIGLSLPIIYYLGILYLGNNLSEIPMPNHWDYSIEIPLLTSLMDYISIIMILVVAIISIFYLFINSTKMAVRNRTFFNVWILFLVMGCLMYLLPFTNLYSLYLICIPFFTLFIAYYLTASSKTWQIELLLIIVSILSFMSNIGF